jgi:hypothetical protein
MTKPLAPVDLIVYLTLRGSVFVLSNQLLVAIGVPWRTHLELSDTDSNPKSVYAFAYIKKRGSCSMNK